VQTSGSAGESIAFGVGVTMPAIMLLGFDMSIGQVMVVAILGGLLGILMMIPLRRAFIVEAHGEPGEPGKLLYPEGTACAQVLLAGESGGRGGLFVLGGFLLAYVHKFFAESLKLLADYASIPLRLIPQPTDPATGAAVANASGSGFNRTAAISTGFQLEMLGVGYIIGAKTAGVMMAGAVLGYLVLIPAIAEFGRNASLPLPPATRLISEMEVDELQKEYLMFIGAGAVAAAGVVSMARTLPTIARTVRAALGSMPARDGSAPAVPRTEDDLPPRFVLLGSLLLLALLVVFLTPDVGIFSALLGAVLVLLFGFLFVMVSARLTGEIGSSSNPISGMTVAALSLTCLIFLALGMTGPRERVLALSVAGVVCIACSNGGTTAQDLKTGFLVGGTPRLQQWAILIGAMTSALVIGFLLFAFNAAGTVYTQKDLPQVDLAPRLSQLTQTQNHEGKTYRVWWATAADGVRAGKYLVDDQGKIQYFVEPAIAGRIKVRDDGTPVSMKFDSPKTVLMATIINGVLKQDLNGALFLIGAMIAVMIELCGLSSLAFAVGVYVPMVVTAPVFVGGMVRWFVDRARPVRQQAGAADSADEVEAIRRQETSPGALLATGLIAGGSLCGVMLACFEFSPGLVRALILGPTPDRPWSDGAILVSQLLSLVVMLGTSAWIYFSDLKVSPPHRA